MDDEEATLREAHAHRATAAMLEAAAVQNETLASALSGREELLADRQSLVEDAMAMRAQAWRHITMAEECERAIRPPAPSPAAAAESDYRPLLTAAALGTAWVLPGGLALGAAAIAVAPHLGIDPDGSARQRVRATLRRDSQGLFKMVIKEDVAGLFIASIYPSDADDERDRLRMGDRLRAIDGHLVRASAAEGSMPQVVTTDNAHAASIAALPSTSAPLSAAPHAAAPSVAAPSIAAAYSRSAASSAASSTNTAPCTVPLPLIDLSDVGVPEAPEEAIDDTSDEPPRGLTLDQTKQLIRASEHSVVLELFREEIKPLVERLGATKTHLEGEMRKAADLVDPTLVPRLEAWKGDLDARVNSVKDEWTRSASGLLTPRDASSSTDDAHEGGVRSGEPSRRVVGLAFHIDQKSSRVSCVLSPRRRVST